jgi:hypothetical protein
VANHAALARAQPRWVPDQDAERCMLCNPDWRFRSIPGKGRHHCRSCGWVVCAGCLPKGQTLELDRWVSSTTGNIRKYGNPTKAKRVCNSCAEYAPTEVATRLRAQDIDITTSELVPAVSLAPLPAGSQPVVTTLALRAARMERAALPLNQGGFGTCVGHSFAQALTTGIQVKYGVPCDPTLVVEKVKTLCECWDGHHTARMPEEWNAVHASSRASIEDMDKRRRYNVRVDCRRIDDFAAARREMLRAEHLRTMMPCTIATDAAGHSHHSVALNACVPGCDDKMSALNSWGAQKTYMDVTPSNFQYAMTFEPTREKISPLS